PEHLQLDRRRASVSRSIGVYLCPRGVFGVECQLRGSGVRVDRTFAFPKALGSPIDAAQHLAQSLDAIRARRTDVSVAVRGFGVAQHMLSLPPAPDALLTPIVDREMRRLEPGLLEPVIGWMTLAAEVASPGEQTPQRQLSAATAPAALLAAVERAVVASGNVLGHVTVAAAALQQIQDEFFAGAEAA